MVKVLIWFDDGEGPYPCEANWTSVEACEEAYQEDPDLVAIQGPGDPYPAEAWPWFCERIALSVALREERKA